eukprot:NODE_3902_length_1265_cov_45.528897_g3423_i0.p1 GENE.NODE_3902_length_1265_cov_45.528897_g3423_i0~~NODE_3902_length_1265_cov_45.528897_g3423_i0.p1  ORF type:complete len:368 (+),score=60.11 NODE_3902_length_1265_cov_45.528897_g3423_i0:58-1161(+)
MHRTILILSTFMVMYTMGINYSLIMTADPGKYTGLPENYYLIQKLENAVNITNRLPYCVDATSGILYGQPVLVVTTGIGHDNAAMCTENILTQYPQLVNEAFYLGTSGFSVRPGGVVNAPDCKPNSVRRDITLLGDVCVSPLSTNIACRFCDWKRDAPNTVCQLPNCWGHDSDEVFGQCSFKGDTKLADEVLKAANNVKFDPPNQVLSSFINKYWALQTNGTGVAYNTRSQPKVLGYNNCSEASTYTLWSGVPDDALCRQYIQQLTPGEASIEDITCVSAMEAVGWMAVLQRPSSWKNGAPIPWTNIRGASDYAHKPVFPLGSSDWQEIDWLSPADQKRMLDEGYHYAIATASQVVLSVFSQRQKIN